MLEVLDLPPCEDIDQGKELVKWAFERDLTLNKDVIIKMVVAEIYKEEEVDSGSQLARGTWIKKFG